MYVRDYEQRHPEMFELYQGSGPDPGLEDQIHDYLVGKQHLMAMRKDLLQRLSESPLQEAKLSLKKSI